MIQFIWICWFLFTLVCVIGFIIRVMFALIWNKPFYSNDTTENAKGCLGILYLIAIMYQLYFWLDYIGFWKEILK